MGFFLFLFGNKIEKIHDFVSRGAIIIDVRTKGEYQCGAAPGSKNIPLQTIASKTDTIKKWNKPIITCCASAASMLKAKGIEAMNGGGWFSLQKKIT